MKNNKKPIAFIIGVTGQDGALLADLLLKKGYEVYGGFRRGGVNKTWRTDFLGITNKINLVEFQLTELQRTIDLFQKIQPDEIYNLAGDSFVGDSFHYPHRIMKINTHGVVNILEAAKMVSPSSKIFFASSSEIFGNNKMQEAITEKSEKNPCNPYAISKLAAFNFVNLYREVHGMFVCSGILFNHESFLRSKHFVTRKITYNMAKLKLNNENSFELGNFDSARDWGSATEYIKAMFLTLQSSQPNDYVISTGKLTTIRRLLEIAATYVGFNPIFEGSGKNEVCIDKSSGRILASVSSKNYRLLDTTPMTGDSTFIKNSLGWESEQNIKQVLHSMLDSDLYRLKHKIND